MNRRDFISKAIIMSSGLSLSSLLLTNCSYLPPKDKIESKSNEIGLYEEWLMGIIALKNIDTPLYNPKNTLNSLEKKFRLIIRSLHYNARPLEIWRETYMPPELIILDSKLKSAFTLPGGFICMTTGMISYAYRKDQSNADEILSSIIAHELGHLYFNHAKKHYVTLMLKNNISRQYREMAEGIKQASGDFSTDYSKLILRTILEAKEQGTKGYQASMEYEADQSAVSILDRAEINPQKLIDAMTLLKHHMGGVHGTYEDRVKRVESAIGML